MTLSALAIRYKTLWRGLAVALVLFLALFNLTTYPTPWYDEGSHLHVPKTLVRLGAYADYSSEGLRYYGPTIGVGPTVMLPIAAVFKVLGIGLWQGRLVIALYLLGAIITFFLLGRALSGEAVAWVATALMVASRGVGLLEYGRQVLGEVPAFFFLALGLWLWLSAWERASWKRLAGVGALLGLSVITKSQFFIVIAPAVFVGWLLNWFYYRAAPHRAFLIPGITLGVFFAVWQIVVIALLGPGPVSANLALYREATASAATVFRPDLMARALRELLSLKVYLGLLLPALAYGFLLALPRHREGQRWGLLWLMIALNLTWYVFASVSWIRYAFLGLALSSLFVARFFADVTNSFDLDLKALWEGWKKNSETWPMLALRAVLIGWCALIVGVSLAQSAMPIVLPPPAYPQSMADYMNANVPVDALVETWEPEMGFLTDHNYHFPPQVLLYRAVSYVWAGGPSPATQYTFVQDEKPAYVLVGLFARYAGLYPPDWLTDYTRVAQIGGYELYRHN